jgi:hypothetical protein
MAVSPHGGRSQKTDSYLFAQNAHWEEPMVRFTNRRTMSMLGGMLMAAPPALAADVTSDRLINADREPQNWLMNHRSYDSQR